MRPASDMPSVTEPLIKDLSNLSSNFIDAFKRAPTLHEFLGMLSEGIRWSRDEMLRDVNGILLESLEARLSTKVATKNTNLVEIPMTELTDALLDASCNALSGASSRFKAARDERPTLAELCQYLVSAIKRCPEDLLLDVPPVQVDEIVGRLRKRGKVSTKPGDVIAIPAEELRDRFYLACIISKNQFGTAFGFFKGLFSPTPPATLRNTPIVSLPIYSGEQCLASGRWFIVGHDEALLNLFPIEPEIFHRPSSNYPFGSAEKSSGNIRTLKKDEATQVGLLNGSYRQGYTCDFLEKHLQRLLHGD